MKQKIIIQIAVVIAALAVVMLGADAQDWIVWMVTKMTGVTIMMVSVCLVVKELSYGSIEVEE